MERAGSTETGPRAAHVVSVSLGDSSRDQRTATTLLGRPVILDRRGTDGDKHKARALFAELDGTVDAFGLGGTDLYVFAGSRRYVLREAAWLVSGVRRTPVLDGSGLKTTLEREAIRRIDQQGIFPLCDKTALLVSGVDRWGMASGLAEHCRDVIYGDLMFGLGLPFEIHRLSTLRRLATVVLPFIVRIPVKWYYPTGEKQRQITPKWGQAYAKADLIAGDFHLIRRFLPPPAGKPLAGKAILTNTTTQDDVALLRERGLSLLVTTTPRFEGRSFGTNVFEACFTALDGSSQPLAPERLAELVEELGWQPEVQWLDDAVGEHATR